MLSADPARAGPAQAHEAPHPSIIPDQHSEPMIVPGKKHQQQDTVAHPAGELDGRWESGRPAAGGAHAYPPVEPQGHFYPFAQMPPPPSYPYPSNYGYSETPYPPSRPPTLLGLPMPFGMPEEDGGVWHAVVPP